jgi:hypothetical protein
MTLRQQYARPRPRAIARHRDHRDQPQLPLTPAHRDQPTPSAWPTHATAAATQPANGRPSPSPRPRLELCPPPQACHRLNPLAWQGKTGHSFTSRAATGSCHFSRHPSPPVPITGVQPAPCAAGSPSSALLPQVARMGRFLWVFCEHPAGRSVWWAFPPLVMVGPAATAAHPISDRQSGATRRHHRGDRNASGPSLTKPHRPRPRT